MRPALALSLALLVLGGLGFFWLRASGVRGGKAAPALQETTTSLASSPELAPATLETSPTRELGGEATEAPAKEPQPIQEESAGSTELAGTIQGGVHGPGGRQLDGVRVWFVDERGDSKYAEAESERYAARELTAGHYWVTADARGHRTGYAEVELAAGAEERLDFELEELVRIDVLVLRPDRRPLTAVPKPTIRALIAVARLSLVENWDPEISGSAENHYGVGRFRPSTARTDEGGIGVLELDGEPPVWVHLCLGQKVLAVRRVEPGEREVVLVLEEDPAQELGTLRIRALAANGTPLPIQSVMTSGSSNVMVNGRGQELVEVADLVQGDHTLIVTAQNHAFQTREVVVLGGVQEVDVEVDLAVRAQGRVVDAGGAPLGATERDALDGPWILLGRIGLGSTTVNWDEDMWYCVDEEGRFSLSLCAGVYFLRAQFEESLSSCLRVDLSHGPIEGLEFTLADPVKLILQREQGEWRGARYELRDEQGLTAAAGAFTGPGPLALRAAEGQYELLVELDGRRVHEAMLVLEREPVTHRFGW